MFITADSILPIVSVSVSLDDLFFRARARCSQMTHGGVNLGNRPRHIRDMIVIIKSIISKGI
jgi:hypothetical protein